MAKKNATQKSNPLGTLKPISVKIKLDSKEFDAQLKVCKRELAKLGRIKIKIVTT